MGGPAGTDTFMNSSGRADLSAHDDNELVQRTLAGDREAYRTLVERHQGRLFTTAIDIVKSREDAEDVVQETFVKAFLSLGQFKGQSSFYTWLYRICFNMAIDLRRRLGRRGGSHLEYKEHLSVNKATAEDSGGESSRGVSPSFSQHVEGPHEVLARKELGRKIQEVLGQLSEEHRAIIILREVDGLDYDEISQAVGIPKGTVMSRLFYARKALQKALEEFAPPPSSVAKNEYDGDPQDSPSAKVVKAR